MSLHSYASLVRRIDKRGGPLEKFLAMPRRPMVLRAMNNSNGAPRRIQIGGEELAARTARCYQSFSNPVVSSSLRLANAERLEWVRKYSLREFKYCVALQDAAAKFVADGGLASLPPSDEFVPHQSAATSQSCSASLLHPPPLGPPSAVAKRPVVNAARYLRNTDNRSYVDEALLHDVLHGAPTHGFSSCVCSAPSASPFQSRRELEVALEAGVVELVDMPFDIALEMLRPQGSVLDVLVNEAALQSSELNLWFSRFCRRRVAWRVLHEHLLHLIRPEVNPQVVIDTTDIVDVLQVAANAVVDIYTKLNVSDSQLVIHLEEDSSLLTSHPEAAYITSSGDCRTRRCDGPGSCALPPVSVAPPPSERVYSVDGQLAYVFREILKNACVATVRWTPDVSVTVRFATDDRWVVVDFVDHAGGISPEHMRDIWKFGWTTSEHYEGHFAGFGVGLPTSKVYMDMWGGSIDVFSTLGTGTTVRVRYPKSPTEVLVLDVPSEAYTPTAPPGSS